VSNAVNAASTTFVAFLYATFVASWAQNTRRNPWLWFFFGFFLPPVAGLVLLWKNGNYQAAPPRLTENGREDLISMRRNLP
jgi:hypothetical protein